MFVCVRVFFAGESGGLVRGSAASKGAKAHIVLVHGLQLLGKAELPLQSLHLKPEDVSHYLGLTAHPLK